MLSLFLSFIHFLTFFSLSLSFSRSLSKTPLANAFHTFHTTSYLPHERRSKGLREICFIIISHIVTDFCFLSRRILFDVIKPLAAKTMYRIQHSQRSGKLSITHDVRFKNQTRVHTIRRNFVFFLFFMPNIVIKKEFN